MASWAMVWATSIVSTFWVGRPSCANVPAAKAAAPAVRATERVSVMVENPPWVGITFYLTMALIRNPCAVGELASIALARLQRSLRFPLDSFGTLGADRHHIKWAVC